MIKVSNGDSVSVVLTGKEYLLKNDEQYRELLLALTDPNPSVQINPNEFAPDPSLGGDDLACAERYELFFKDYLAKRDERLRAHGKEIKDALTCLEELTEKLKQGGCE